MRREIGTYLMMIGMKLIMSTKNAKEDFKDHINDNTWIGSMSESGGHILSGKPPMSDYEIYSIRNVIMHRSMMKKPANRTIKLNQYRERWIP